MIFGLFCIVYPAIGVFIYLLRVHIHVLSNRCCITQAEVPAYDVLDATVVAFGISSQGQ